MRPKRSRRLISAIAVAVAFGASIAPAGAASLARKSSTTTTTPGARRPDPNHPGSVVNSWALAPTGPAPGEPSTRPNLTYEVQPGSEIKDSVTLFNYSNVQLTFRIYATDALNNGDGEFDMLPGDKNPVGAGSWVTLPQPNITVPASSSATLPITVKVPPDATAGDHAGAILASSQAQGSSPDGKLITLDRRTGSRMYIRVAGPLQPNLDVENVRSVFHPSLNPLGGSLDVTYTVRNKGNVRMAAKQRLSLRAPFGIELDREGPPDLPELLPGNAVTRHTTFTGAAATGILGARVSMAPVDQSLARAGSARTGRALAMPWTILVVLVSIGLVLRSRNAHRRRLREGLTHV